jgi:hypothetical protein
MSMLQNLSLMREETLKRLFSLMSPLRKLRSLPLFLMEQKISSIWSSPLIPQKTSLSQMGKSENFSDLLVSSELFWSIAISSIGLFLSLDRIHLSVDAI